MSDRLSVMMKIGLMIHVIFLGLSGWNYHRLVTSREAAVWAVEDAAGCETIATRIQALGDQPSQADSQDMRLQDLTRRIEDSVRQAGIASGNLVRISPQTGSRIGQTPYRKKSTQVTLRGVSLEQAVRFHHTLESQGAGLHVSSLRLTSAKHQTASGRWTCESTLTHIIYAPIMTGPSSPTTEPTG